MKVLKFGGTSVGTPERFRRLPSLIREQLPAVVVLSAVAGTTDKLERLAEMLREGEQKDSFQLAGELEQDYVRFIYRLFEEPEEYNRARLFVEGRFIRLRTLLDQPFSAAVEHEILAQGELLSTGLLRCLLNSLGESFRYLYAPDLIVKDEDGMVDMEHLEMALKKVLDEDPDTRLFITQGFICADREGRIDTLGRGGSDFTASLIGAVLPAEEIQIWTDVDGVHNNDPRVVQETSPIPVLSYEEADELAYFGAKVLHPACVFPAQRRNIPIRIKNTLRPEAEGTLVQDKKNGSSIKAVAAKDGITAVRIRSTRMLNAYGFLRKVFEVFERYRTPIDMISTSEVSVSLTIDDRTHLHEIVEELKRYGMVEIDRDQSIICVVGDFMAERPGMVRHVFNALQEIPVRMISYGGSMNNISLLLHSRHKGEALKALHRHLFLNSNSEVHVH